MRASVTRSSAHDSFGVGRRSSEPGGPAAPCQSDGGHNRRRQLNPSEAQLKNFPGSGTAIAGRQMLADAQISSGVMKPLDVLVEHGGDPQQVAVKLRGVPGIVGATAPPTWHHMEVAERHGGRAPRTADAG